MQATSYISCIPAVNISTTRLMLKTRLHINKYCQKDFLCSYAIVLWAKNCNPAIRPFCLDSTWSHQNYICMIYLPIYLPKVDTLSE